MSTAIIRLKDAKIYQKDHLVLSKVNFELQSGDFIYLIGKTGTGKRINMEMSSSVYKFSLNIRDTQGKDGYPTRLMCDFKYK